MAIVSIKWAGLKDPNKQPSLQDATGAAPVTPVPTFTSATASSYTVAITGYDAQFTYTVSSSVGSAVRTGGNVTVSGLSANQSSTLTVTAANTARDLSLSSAVAFLSLPNVPTLTQATQTSDGGTITITNYDASATYTISATAGSVSRTSNTITLTGLSRGQSSIVSVTASNSSGNTPTATLAVSAEPLGEFESIATIVVPSGGMSAITFNNIPQTYQHLQLRIVERNAAAATYSGSFLRINSDVGNNYARHAIDGDGATASTIGFISTNYISPAPMAGSNATASIFGAMIIDIFDYSSTIKTKTIKALGGTDANGSGSIRIASGLWNNTNAVSSITISDSVAASISQYSTASLYGIKAP